MVLSPQDSVAQVACSSDMSTDHASYAPESNVLECRLSGRELHQRQLGERPNRTQSGNSKSAEVRYRADEPPACRDLTWPTVKDIPPSVIPFDYGQADESCAARSCWWKYCKAGSFRP
jgi:hypothetical protein